MELEKLGEPSVTEEIGLFNGGKWSLTRWREPSPKPFSDASLSSLEFKIFCLVTKYLLSSLPLSRHVASHSQLVLPVKSWLNEQ
jgi:hypothetical protein